MLPGMIMSVVSEVSTNPIMDTKAGRKRRHRSWPEALKREIVAAAAAPGASVSVVARQYDVNTNMVFTWRKLYGAPPHAPSTPNLVPVVVTPDPPVAAPLADSIEIELVCGHRLRIGASVQAATLRLVLDALERR